jgi:TolB-like protein/Tfp pilus assembly protein PilF/Ser/Thr protein kinase RdoA (MazF antagonist)
MSDLPAGSRLGRYEILAEIGAGGMGRVYRARDVVLGREVAVKVLSERLSSEPEFRARFEREARAVAALSHPNVLAIHDYGVEADVCFAVTELLEGATLREQMREALPWRRAAEIGREIAAGLAATHARGIIHRDLKPENVFLTTAGSVKILDFGLARQDAGFADGSADSLAPTTGPATRTGVVMGTVGYMAPEQVRGARADAASDLFSLGCVLYEMLAGRPPFAGATASDVLAATLRDEPVPLSRTGAEMPAALADAVGRCLAKEPAKRWSSAAELSGAILRALREEPREQPAPAQPQAAPRPPRSLAVLPLRNPSGDPEADYLAEGIAESLIDALSRLPGLRVMARTTVFRLGPEADPRRVGAELSVAAVLGGRILRRGSDLRIAVELVDTAQGWRLWGADFHGHEQKLQETVRSVVSGVGRTLGVSDSDLGPPPPAPPSASREAYLLDLKGRYNWNKSSVPAIRKAIEFFGQAIDVDPVYAPAYAGLSDCYAALGMDRYGAMSPRESLPRAKAAARKALEIDEALDEAHTSLGYAEMLDLNWAAADRELRRAVDLNPERARARHSYGFFLATQARFAESQEQFARALDLDPLSLIVQADFGWSYYCARDYDRAREQLERTAEIDAGFPQTYLWLGLTCIETGDTDRAVAAFEKALELTHGSTTMLGGLAMAHAKAGEVERVREIEDRIETARAAGQYVTNVCLLNVSLATGNHDAALGWLERSFEQRASYMIALKVYPFLDPLRESPRFRSLMARSGLLG